MFGVPVSGAGNSTANRYIVWAAKMWGGMILTDSPGTGQFYDETERRVMFFHLSTKKGEHSIADIISFEAPTRNLRAPITMERTTSGHVGEPKKNTGDIHTHSPPISESGDASFWFGIVTMLP